MTGAITRQTDDAGVCRITIDRADKRNALDHRLMAALADAVASADADGAVRVLLLDSPGPVFCAGADLANLRAGPPAGTDPGHAVLLALAAACKPVVAAVQGAAVGMGATMLLHCDAIYAAPRASIHMPFVELGLTPEGGATFLLPARMGAIRAARLLLATEPMGAEDAYVAGLVTQVVAAEILAETALAAARRLAGMPPEALARTKAMLRASDLLARMDAEQEVFRSMLGAPEFAQAVAAAQARLTRG